MYMESLSCKPDYLLVYADKKSLKKREPVVIPLRFIYYAIGVAASIAFLILLVSRKPAEQVLLAPVYRRNQISIQNKKIYLFRKQLSRKGHQRR